MSKKAQFTMYVILGIVVLAVVGIGLYFRERNVENTIDEQADKIIAEFLAKGVKNYIELCLTSVSDEGLKRIGLQGGMLLDYQGGSYLPDPSKLGEDFIMISQGSESYYVFYGIKAKEGLDPPEYPVDGVRFSDYEYPYFGRNTLVKLCDKDGPNRPGVVSEVAHPCLAGTYNNLDTELTIQKQLQEYVVSNMNKCVNLSFYLQNAGHNISLDGNVTGEVIFGYNGVTFSLVYPLTVRVRNSEPVQKTKSFTAFSKVRFKEIYNLAYTLINKDTADIYFDAEKNYSSLYNWAPGMTVMVADNPCVNCTNGRYDNIIYIQDSKSLIKGEPYVFQFAVKNRRPAIDTNLPSMINSRNVDLQILAADPDDNNVTINFTGWRQDFKTDSALCADDDCLHNIDSSNSRSFSPLDWDWNSTMVSDNKIIRTLEDVDRGDHSMNITVVDEEGLRDWQEIHFVVN